jgi:3-oxoacyl-[acyl-carrier-protein] synthase II
VRRVVVTGLGIVSPLGTGLQKCWSGLREGRSGIRPISRFDASSHTTRIAGEVPDFEPERFIDPREVRRLDLFQQYALAASHMALEDAGLEITGPLAERAGVYVASGIGGIQSFEDARDTLRDRGPRKVSPFAIPRILVNLASGVISIRYGLKGPAVSHVSACAAGSHAIGEAFQTLQCDRADVMLAGGAEAAITPLAIAAFNQMRALSTRNDEPAAASRPFEKDRDGFVLSEGAGVLVLEELEHARRRGATVYCELVGYGATSDAHHVTAPAPGGEGAIRCMRQALASARVDPAEVQYINAHGTGTELNDQLETEAVKALFGDHARSLWISSNKSMFGHLLGAAGGVEAVATALTVHHGIVPPTINHQTPDPACDLDVVPNIARERRIDVALSNSFGFGGMNASLVFRRFDG